MKSPPRQIRDTEARSLVERFEQATPAIAHSPSARSQRSGAESPHVTAGEGGARARLRCFALPPPLKAGKPSQPPAAMAPRARLAHRPAPAQHDDRADELSGADPPDPTPPLHRHGCRSESVALDPSAPIQLAPPHIGHRNGGAAATAP